MERDVVRKDARDRLEGGEPSGLNRAVQTLQTSEQRHQR